MAFALDDRVKETSITTGTGTYNLDGAVSGFQTFVAGIGSTNTCWYSATDGTNWEVGIGTVTDATPDTLARTTILSSSNADAAVNWGAGVKTLACTFPAYAAVNKGFDAMKVYTATGASTWSKTTGLSFVVVEAVGGGGGGAGSLIAAGSGGGAGGYARRAIAAASLGATETVTVGSGGAGGISGGAGAAGGVTTFGTFLTACGGGPGLTGASGAIILGGSGGLATSGDINSKGGDGYMALAAGSGALTTWYGGQGGGSYFGSGGIPLVRLAVSGAALGTLVAPGAFGAGGGGGVGSTSGGASGAVGKTGIVVVYEFI